MMLTCLLPTLDRLRDCLRTSLNKQIGKQLLSNTAVFWPRTCTYRGSSGVRFAFFLFCFCFFVKAVVEWGT